MTTAPDSRSPWGRRVPPKTGLYHRLLGPLVGRIAYRIGGEVMIRYGLHTRKAFVYVRPGSVASTREAPAVPVANFNGSFRGVLRGMWENHGLGRCCLLVSESRRVAAELHSVYPATDFVTTDLNAQGASGGEMDRPDIVWDVCLPPPEALASRRFDSVVAQCLLEHVVSPAEAVASFLSVTNAGGHVYLVTHTPFFRLHQAPNDFLRFTHDFFFQLPAYVKSRAGITAELVELYSKDAAVTVCYKRTR